MQPRKKLLQRLVIDNMKWISVKDRLPKIPKGQYGISVLVVTFDEIYDELSHGKGQDVSECTYGLLHDCHDRRFPMFKGNKKTEDFYCCYYPDGEPGPMGDPVTHWMYLPRPPKIGKGK